MSVLVLQPGDDLAAFCHVATLPALDGVVVRAARADLHLLAHDPDGRGAARASLWWTQAPPLRDQVVGCIGHYAASSAQAAAALLTTACARLAAAGCSLAVGPLDGSTFRAYRFVTEFDLDGTARAPFFLEPVNPPDWPAHFVAAGFDALAHYESAVTALDGPDPRLAEMQAHGASLGVCLRPVNLDDFDAEAARLYPVVMAAFRPNLLFAPISQTEFIAQVAALRPLLHPRLVQLAEIGGEVVGFLLAMPDANQARRGTAVDTVILKTLAVLPEVAGSKVGSLLAAAVHTHAHALGYRTAIHALMHVDNRSRRISAHYARPFRGYTLFARPLS